MLDLYYRLIDVLLPFSWAQYAFMKNALLAVIWITPVFALLGTAVVSNRMAFFSDVLGHSALTGVALGVILGVTDPFWPMLIFLVVLAVGVNWVQNVTKSSTDTILGVFFAGAVAFGIVVLSKGGGFNKYTTFLIGDILAVSPQQLVLIAGLFLLVIIYWYFYSNALSLMSVNPVLARSRGINVRWLEISFVILLAVVVAVSIRLVGILIINSLLVLPAAAARNLANNIRQYTHVACLTSVVSGICGLILSYYWGTASGATIVLFCCAFYILSAIFVKWVHKRT